MGEERVKKSRSRRPKDVGGSGGGVGVGGGPTTVVCTANSSSNNIELGLLISLFIVVVYVFGFYESVISVPDVDVPLMLKSNSWYKHLGENLNVARSEFTAVLTNNINDNNSNINNNNKSNNNNNNKQIDSILLKQEQQLQRQRQRQQGQFPEGISRMDVIVGGHDTANSQQQQQQQQQTPNNHPSVVGKLNMPVGLPEEQVVIPPHKWPVTIRDELDDYEPLVHSGDRVTVLQVPKLWSLPVHNYRQFTREKAMKMGSCSVPDANGNIVRGDACPPDDRTIFVAIASYRDFECRTTVESIFLRAKNPKRIRVGESLQFFSCVLVYGMQ